MMSAMGEYYLWLEESSREDSRESQQAYMAILEGVRRGNVEALMRSAPALAARIGPDLADRQRLVDLGLTNLYWAAGATAEMIAANLREHGLTSTWHLDGKGITDGGDVGGEIQVGKAWSVTYLRDDMPGSLIIETVCVVKTPSGRGHGYAYETRSTYLVCTDPADPEGTKVWSHTEKDGSLCDYPTAKEASDDAWQVVLRINTDAQAGAHDGWDGTPSYGKDG
jgi:hypothetical protein